MELFLVRSSVILKIFESSAKTLLNFPSPKNVNVSRYEVGSLMKKYGEQELLSQPRRILISSYSLEDGT